MAATTYSLCRANYCGYYREGAADAEERCPSCRTRLVSKCPSCGEAVTSNAARNCAKCGAVLKDR